MKKTAFNARTISLLVIGVIALGSLAKSEDQPSSGAGKSRRISAAGLTGRWQGNKDGIKITLKFASGEASWVVEQSLPPNGQEQIEADHIGLVNRGDAGSVDLKEPLKSADGKVNATVAEKSRLLGTLQAGSAGSLVLTILPGSNYHAVEGLMLRRTDKPTYVPERLNLSDAQASTFDVLSNLGFEEMPCDESKPKAFPKFTVTKKTLDFLKQYEGKTIEVADDGSLEIEEH